MGRLTTHILDTANGRPAADVAVRLYLLGDERRLVTDTHTNADGRTDAPLLEDIAFESGSYELEFELGDYFRRLDSVLTDPPFLDVVVIRFQANADEHYHVPLLASPFSYSTYRGS